MTDCLVRTRAAGEADKCADAIVPNIDVLDDAQLARKTRIAVSPSLGAMGDVGVPEVFEITLGLISLRAARVQLEFESQGRPRPGQELIYWHMVDGRDAIYIAPAGAGKTCAFLSEDQPAQKRVLSRDLRSALVTLRCQGRLHGFIVDECRCVASWGRGFRPAYGRIGEFANLPLPPVSTVYCTATPTTVLEGVRQLVGLFIDVPVVWRPLSRTNLGLEVEHLDPGSPLVAAVLRRLQDTLGELEPGSRVVVYVVSKQVDKDLATTF
ncbi:hypothetical protein T492DRAFT_888453 [Pavlovales sp. CCMP2436]|nr:hypothetical protein T492DRAFT_888453 [Pavlovales sp. CCMP2436]